MAAPKKREATAVLVVAPLVQIRLGDKVVQLSRGDVVPENASQESLDHLRGLGFISDGSASSDTDDEK